MTAATAHDAAVAADRLPFDHDEVIEFIRVQDAWDATTDKVEQLVPSLFVSASRKKPDNSDPRIIFTTAPPSTIIDLLKALPFDTTVLVGSRLNESSLEYIAGLAYRATTEVPGARVLSTFSNPEAGSVTITVEFRTTDDLLAAEQSAASAALALSGYPVVVQRAPTDSPNELLSHTGGGKDLDYQGSLNCTSGFATVSGGMTGVSTAKHCENSLTWDTRTGIIAFDHEASNPSDRDSEVDVQFHRDLGQNVSAPTFFATGSGQSDIRTVLAKSNAKVGDYVYKYGRVGSYAGPSRVEAVNVSYDAYDGTFTFHHYIGAARVDLSTASWQHGDSGGPVFSGNTAKGSVAAINVSKDDSYGYYTPQTRWGENMNASIIVAN